MKGAKVKNPCKICSDSVNNKNGIQCQGACKKWSHFKCLNYTPGKISDIKAGLIKITCPCPDCKESDSKEVCPASKPRKCEAPDCPKKHNPLPPFPPHVSVPPMSVCPRQPPQGNAPCFPPAPKCTMTPIEPRRPSPPRMAPPVQKCSPPRRICSGSSNYTSPKSSYHTPACARPPCQTCPQHCPKNSNPQLPKEKVISPQRSQSCSFDCPSIASVSSNTGVSRCCSSDSALLSLEDQKLLYKAIEQMCNTVGHLSNQLKDLMSKMVNTFQKGKACNSN